MPFTTTLTPFQLSPTEEWTVAKFNQGFNPTVVVSGNLEAVSNWNTVSTQSKTFTVASLPDDEITVASHGITAPGSVDAVIRATVSSTVTLPAGLAASSTFFYYIRVKDANTLTLHTTAAGALANTNRVDISSSGTGTHTITYMAYNGLFRPLTYNSGSAKWEYGVVARDALPEMLGASASTNGARGAVPQPTTADSGKFLRADGTWVDAIADTRTAADFVLYLNTY